MFVVSDRGAIEAAAWCCCLEDPTASSTDTVGRALTERMTSVAELNKLGRAANYAEQLAQMQQVAARFAINPIPRSKENQEPKAFGEERPTVTTLWGKLLPTARPETAGLPLGRHTYRTLSARAHATGWDLIEGAVPIEKVDAHSTMVYITAEIPELLRVLRIAADLHRRAVRQRLTSAGRSEQKLADAVQGLPAFEVAQAS
jgi:hypothetical protein